MGSTRQDYRPSSLVKVPSKKNVYYVYVTRPRELQSKGKQAKRSTRTTDFKIAQSKQHEITEQIYQEFDQQLSELNSFEVQLDRLLEGRGLSRERLRALEPDGELPDQTSLILLLKSLGVAVTSELVAAMKPEFRQEVADLGTEQTPVDLLADVASSIAKQDARDKFSDYLPHYLEGRPWNRINTRNEAKRYIKLFIEQTGDLRISELKVKHAYDWAQMMHDAGSSNSRIKAAISYVRGLLQWCIERGHIEQNPWETTLKLKNYGVKKQHYKPFTKTQLHNLFALDMKTEDRLLLTILVSTGMRLDEAALLSWDNIKIEGEAVPHFDLLGGIVKNTGSERFVAIPDVLLRRLPTKGQGRLFSYPIDADGKAQRKASERLGKHIHKIRSDPKQVTHSLRGTLKDLLRDAGVSKEVNDFITGHDQGDQAGNYGQGPSLKVRQEAVNRIEHPWLK
jgi:integrase